MITDPSLPLAPVRRAGPLDAAHRLQATATWLHRWATGRRYRVAQTALARAAATLLGPTHAGGPLSAPDALLGERIRVLAQAQGLLTLLLLGVNLLMSNATERWVTTGLAIPAGLATVALYRLSRTRYGEAAVYADLIGVALILALGDPLSGSLSGTTWVLFQIWPPLAALTLRRPRAVVLGVGIPLLLLLISALLQITQVVPVVLLMPPELLLRHLSYQVLLLLVLGGALHWMSKSEQRAWRTAVQMQGHLHRELARAQALAAEKVQLNATLEQRVAERSAVAEQRAAALAASEERYALAARAANDGLWDWDLTTQQIFFSPRWKAILGYADAEIGTAPTVWYDLLHPDDRSRVLARLATLLQNPDDPFELEYRMGHKDGTYRWMLCRGLALREASGRVTRLVGAQTDITDRKLGEARLRYNALHDPLTSLPNRTLFLDRLGQAIKRGRGEDAPGFALLFLDLDRFKTVNDSLGHRAGDELLIAVARRLEGALRPGDTLARLNGDEFAILLEPLAGATAATDLATQLQRTLAPPFPLRGQDIFMSASVGIAPGTGGYVHAEDMLRDADAALHRAKLEGTARQAVFDSPIYCEALTRLQLETELHRALERGEFRLHYQPIVLLSNTLVVGFEALLRWQHPERGLLAPGEFLALAEDIGLLTPLSYWVLDEACHQLAAWQTEPGVLPPLTMSVNMPARPLTEPALITHLARSIAETGLTARQLKLEIVENTLVAEGEAAAALARIKGLGVQISIDDFGIGYSSLSYLHRIPADTLKIDRSFVSRLGTDQEHAEIVAAIITLARSLGMSTVAEGVETPEQRRLLQGLGCDYGQGWLFAPALAPEQATALVSSLRLPHPASLPR